MLTSVLQKIQLAIRPPNEVKNLVWMDTLSEQSDLDALRTITAQLAKITFDTKGTLQRRIDLVLGIDKRTYRHAKKITYKYLTVLKLSKTLEADMYDAVYSYQRQLYTTYTQFLDAYLAQNKVVIDAEIMNVILCRFLNATFAMAKWRYFEDQPAPLGTWLNVAKIIRCAENLSIMNTNLFMYSYQKKETSIATLLKQGFMMDTLHKGNYSRLQIQLTEQVLKIWASNPLIFNKHKQDKFHFFIDINADKGPERIRTVEKFAEYRFWKTTRIVDKLEAYLCAFDTQKPLAEFGLDKMASTETTVGLFKKLRVDWCVEGYERQRRKETRHVRNKLINVSYGLDDIARRLNALRPTLIVQPIKQAAEEDGLYDFEMQVATHRAPLQAPQVYEKKNKLGSENWWLVDESAKGFGVDLGRTYSGWIEAGKLIGYTTPVDKQLFIIAEVKSVRKQANGSYRAGLEVISTQANAVKVGRLERNHFTEALKGYFVEDDQAAFDAHNHFAALLLEAVENAKTKQSSLIIPRREYKRGGKLTVNIKGEDKIIEMGAVLSRQREWVRFAVLPSLN